MKYITYNTKTDYYKYITGLKFLKTYVFTIATFISLLVLLIGKPVFASSDLDSSWMIATSYLWQKGFVFGKDIIFTYGPLSFLSTHLFEKDNYIYTIINDIILSVIFLSVIFYKKDNIKLVTFSLLILVLPLQNMDSLAFVAIFSGYLIMLKARPSIIAVICIALTPTCLSKFSYILVMMPLVFICDLHLLVKRRIFPFVTLLYFLVLTIAMYLTNMIGSEFNVNWRGLLDIILGYSQAMQTNGLGPITKLGFIILHLEILIFSAWYIFLAIRLHMKYNKVDNNQYLTSICAILGLLWYMFIVFKAGYTRLDDYHIVIAWASIVLSIPVFIFTIYDKIHISKYVKFEIAFMVILGSILLNFSYFITKRMIFAPKNITFVNTIAHSKTILSFLSKNSWNIAQIEQNKRMSIIGYGLSKTDLRTVDVIPSDIAPVIAAGLNYHPRPVIQSYSSYTKLLQNIEVKYFNDSTRAPNVIFYSLGYTPDNRLPTLDVGPSFIPIRKWYIISGQNKLGLILTRKKNPSVVKLQSSSSAYIDFNQWVKLPKMGNSDYIIAKIDFPRTLFGKLLGFFLRENPLTINIRDYENKEKSFRFIPSMSKVGFVISPVPNRIRLNDLVVTRQMMDRSNSFNYLLMAKSISISGNSLSKLSFEKGSIKFKNIKFQDNQ